MEQIKTKKFLDIEKNIRVILLKLELQSYPCWIDGNFSPFINIFKARDDGSSEKAKPTHFFIVLGSEIMHSGRIFLSSVHETFGHNKHSICPPLFTSALGLSIKFSSFVDDDKNPTEKLGVHF